MDKAYFDDNVNRYTLLAVKTVISFFKEERIRLNVSDFDLSNVIKLYDKKATEVRSFFDYSAEMGNTIVTIKYKEERFKKYVGNKYNNFLKYVNARVTKDEIIFSFTWKELDSYGVEKVSFDETDAQKEKINKIKVLIEKLFALANNNPSENEALSANNKAQALLAKYHLSLEEVYGAEMKIGDDIEQVICDCGVGMSKCNWRYNLAGAIADGYCCKTYSVGNMADGRVVFYGYCDDVLLARRMYTFLFETCHKLGLKYQRENANFHNPYYSFCVGFVEGARAEMEKQCTALALVIQPEVEEAWEEFSESFGERKQRKNSIELSAFEEGRVEGKRSLRGKYIDVDSHGEK